MSRPAVVIAALAIVLASAGAAAAQVIVCPAETRYAFRPREDGGRIEYCETAAARVHGPYLATDGEAARLIQGQFVDGKAIGRWNGWYPNGRAAGEADFEAGEIRRLVAWNTDGVVVFQVDLKAGGVAMLDRGKLAQTAALNQAVEAREFVRTIVYIAAISAYR